MSFPPAEFSVRRDHSARVLRLTPVGELDLATAATFEEALSDALDSLDEDALMVVDLTKLGFIDSSGIRTLLEICKRGSGRVRIVNGSPAVERLFGMLGIRSVLPVIAPDDDPLEALPAQLGR